jgi:LysR family glycine cleavage system transcriptional activator
MQRRPPTLDSLRFFEAAARHLSFSRAAEELNVSQAAVSQRIRSLEHALGASLFRRQHRRLALTALGSAYVLPVREALQRLDRATEQLFPRMGSRVLTLRLSPSLATLWLMPRLPDFYARCSDLELRLVTTMASGSDDPLLTDLEIRQKPQTAPGEWHEALLTAEILPVAAPLLLKRIHDPEKPADLLHLDLLHVIGYEEDWQGWFAAAGLPEARPGRGQQFDASHLAIRAAEDGLGVALVRSALVADALGEGRLIRLFPEVFYRTEGYHLFGPLRAERARDLDRVRRWLLETARAFEAVRSPPELTK